MHRFANPRQFLKLANAVLPWCAGATVVLLAVGLYMSFFLAPADYQQGEAVRIMFVHVPSAWMALFVYTNIAIASAVGLIWKHPLAHLVARASAPVGAAFTFLALLSGSLWGKPMWGTWWVWDARLTSVLVLFFFYLGYMALASAYDEPTRADRASAILALVGFVNVPIIKFSVEWWNTLHQPASVFKASGPAIHPMMLWPLMIMAVAFTFYFVTVLLWRVKAEIAARKIRMTQLAHVHQSAAAAVGVGAVGARAGRGS